LRRVRQRAFVIQNPYVIPRVEIAAANVASEKVFRLADAPPVSALAEHRPAWSRFFEWHDRRLGWVHLGFHRDIARGAVKDDAVHGFEDRKAFGNAIHLYIERAIHLWKFGEANPAHGTKKTFNPMIAERHPTNMQPALAPINVLFGCHNQMRKTWVPSLP
jgi:hypothetical protein